MISFILPNRNEDNIHRTVAEIEKLFPGSQIIISCDRYSRGKGYAIREGMEHFEHDIICFLDADMDIHPFMVKMLLPHLSNYDIVVGTKPITMSLRGIITLLSRIYIRLFFGIKVDTQTGIKLFSIYALPRWKTDTFAFDIEILYKAKRNGFSMCEIPILAKHTKKMPMRSIISTFIDSLKIWWKYSRRLYI